MATITSLLLNAQPQLTGHKVTYPSTGIEATSGPVTLRLIRTGEFTGEIASTLQVPTTPFSSVKAPKPSAATFIELMVQLERVAPQLSVAVRSAIIELFTQTLQ